MDERADWRYTLVSAVIYLEGGGDSKALRTCCKEGFRKLLIQCGFVGRLPKLVACGGRGATFDHFVIAQGEGNVDFVAMWVDSEDLVADLNAAWDHLKARDGWQQPDGAANEQVLMSATCMETLIVADQATLAEHFNGKVQESALPPLVDLEKRDRHDIQDRLTRATRNCSNAYTKGKRSFEVLSKLKPDVLEELLPSFARARRILEEKL